MKQQSELIMASFDYRLTTERLDVEAVVAELVAAGVPSDNVHVVAPPHVGLADAEGQTPRLDRFGLDEGSARWSVGRYREGKAVLLVRPGERRREVEEVLRRQGALEVHHAGAGTLSTDAT